LARIVVAASPLSGHVLPLIRIGAHLQKQGHDVVVLAGADYGDSVTDAGLSFEPLDAAAHPREAAKASASRKIRLFPTPADPLATEEEKFARLGGRRVLVGDRMVTTANAGPLLAALRAGKPVEINDRQLPRWARRGRVENRRGRSSRRPHL
jgi:UDP:flavonoid glycosyltransferase YjiC (YdhE family)